MPKSARSELWAFICRSDLKQACQNLARKRQMSDVQWLEETLQRAVNKHERTNVKKFIVACLQRAPGEEVPLIAVYARYRNWCDEQDPKVTPYGVARFDHEFKSISQHLELRTRQDGNRVYCLDAKLVA